MQSLDQVFLEKTFWAISFSFVRPYSFYMQTIQTNAEANNLSRYGSDGMYYIGGFVGVITRRTSEIGVQLVDHDTERKVIMGWNADFACEWVVDMFRLDCQAAILACQVPGDYF